MKEVFLFIKKYYSLIFFILIIVLSTILFQTCSILEKERKEREYQEKLDAQNMNAFKDSIVVLFNKKLNAWEYSKDNYVLQELEDLKKYNKELYNELNKIKGDLIAAIKTDAEIDLGGISVGTGLKVLDDKNNYYALTFESEYKDKGLEQVIQGMSKFSVNPNNSTKKWTINPDTTVFSKNLTNVKITYGFKELKDKYHVFALSSSDKVKLTELDGAYFIDKQPAPAPSKIKKWGLGPYIGYGLSVDPNVKTAQFGWNVGIGVHYNIIRW